MIFTINIYGELWIDNLLWSS